MLFKIASEAWEFEAIHRLNYRTFVEEIPQHPANAERRLVDRFHAENTYAICLDGERLAGMVCGRGGRPFSLDAKLADLDAHLPVGRKVFEVRLLAVEPRYRNRTVFARLAGLLAEHFREAGFDFAVISGTTRQFRLYEHLGFVSFGPLVGSGEARFQPMCLTLESFVRKGKALAHRARAPVSFLCGPVDIHKEVRKAFSASPLSHRSERFLADFEATRRMLCALAGAREAQVLLGSGTLANDAVAAQLAASGERGLVLSNGEFGERLVDHASRHALRFDLVRAPWGSPFDYGEIGRRVAADPGLRWLWAVHCETSTGMLNGIGALRSIADAHRAKLCLDCISSIGASPVDLTGVHLATCVSGKALSAFPGLAIVFHHGPVVASPAAPRYLDLGYYAAQSGVPFTGSSNLIHALQAALVRSDWQTKFRATEVTGAWLRRELRAAGIAVVAPEACAAPAVTTLALPPAVSSRVTGERLRHSGFLVGYQSAYLVKRNWLQIALMGEWDGAALGELVETLKGNRATNPIVGWSPERAPNSMAAAVEEGSARGMRWRRGKAL
jgi:aspartate aminotransferase-like enzyme/GNAT superfamily N-acetyltransferase